MIYTIKKGWHYSLHWPKFHFGIRKKTIRFRFLDGCWFPPVEPDDFAINKLFGWSYGYHHKNSVRVGWTPNKEVGKIDIFFYLYQNGRRAAYKFATIEIGHECELEMDVFCRRLYFDLKINGMRSAFDSAPFIPPRMKAGYFLFPYIGGRLPARVDTKIELEFL